MKKNWVFLGSILLFHLIILNILQFTAWPEMVSFPYFINHGFITYKDMVHAYPPLLINILAILYKTFGYKLIILKLSAWVSFLINDVLLILILKKVTKKINLAFIFLFFYILIQPFLEGNMIWPDLVMIPFLLGGFLFFLNKKYFFSSILFALALLTKQSAIFYIVITASYLLIFERKKMFNFILGILVIILPFLTSLLKQNSLNDFVNWTIIYPSKYWTKFPGYVQLSPSLREYLILMFLFLPMTILVIKVNKKIFSNKTFLLVFGFVICVIIGVYPRFSFFHLQPSLAFLVILYSILISKYQNTKTSIVYLIILIATIVFLSHPVFGGTRFWSSDDIILAKTIQNETLQNQPVYLIGLDSSLYAFSDRLPNKPWLDNFGWYLEIPGVQENVIKSFSIRSPSTIFWQTPQDENWYDIDTYQPKKITGWIKKNYVYKKEVEKGISEWVKR